MIIARMRAQGRELRDLQRAYRSLLYAYHTERQRAATAVLAATEPCLRCETSEHERDEAVRELDEVRAALVWLERDLKLG